ncbi:MAG: DNA polymerase III subunit gamma/tau [Clostridiales bacterium]|nr:DNA polymerase III subunit gamma/tau [Clostridiales bacterium]
MEHVALYRLYRPMNFDEIVEQEHAVSALRQSVISGKIGHAYLFCGTRGTGKTSIAKVFSRAINCLHPVNGNPCNECEICKGVIDGSLLDVIEMDAASNNSVDNIRRICDEVMFMPAKAKYKVYIIDEVHMLSTGAFNALLKTLEEPPAHAVFLLATTEPHRIPATILSRCQRYDFRRISNESIVKRLSHIAEKQNIAIESDALSAIATIGDGALRDSVSLLDQVSTTSNGKTITRDDILRITGIVDEAFLNRFATAILEGRAADLLPLCRELFMDGRDLIRFTLDLTQYFRNILVTQVSSNPQSLIESTSAAIAAMKALGQRTDSTVILFFISRLSDLVNELKWSPSPRTSFEITMLRLASRGNKIAPPIIPPVTGTAAPAPAAPVAPTPVEAPAPVKEEIPAPPVPPIAQIEIPATVKVEAPVKEAEPVKEEVPEPPKVEVSFKVTPPPALEDVSLPPPPLDPEPLAPVSMPVSESVPVIPDIPEIPMPSDADIPAPSDEDMPPLPEEIDIPTAEELAHTKPTSPNLHKAFASEHVSEGQTTNLAKATRQPEVRVPQMPRDILREDGESAPKAEPAPVSNVKQVIRHSGGDEFSSARTEFLEYLKKDYTFEYMYMCDSKIFWKDQNVWCIMPDSFAQSIDDIRKNPLILTQLLKICQKYEPSLINVHVSTQQEYDSHPTSEGTETSAPEAPSQPDWVKAVTKVSEENGIPLTHVKDM